MLIHDALEKKGKEKRNGVWSVGVKKLMLSSIWSEQNLSEAK